MADISLKRVEYLQNNRHIIPEPCDKKGASGPPTSRPWMPGERVGTAHNQPRSAKETTSAPPITM